MKYTITADLHVYLDGSADDLITTLHALREQLKNTRVAGTVIDVYMTPIDIVDESGKSIIVRKDGKHIEDDLDI